MANASHQNSKRFKRNVEDFKCERCEFEVKGTGYTDHCPNCLYSKHVDINPGDRLSKCKGLMKPVRTESNRVEFVIYYKCSKCGFRHRVHASKEDNKELLIELLA
jgi:rubrerythrin